MSLGERLLRLRKEKDKTQLELSNVLNVTKSAVSSWEKDKAVPNDDIKIELARYFNVSVDYLIGYSDIKNPYINIINPDETLNKLISEYNDKLANSNLDISKYTKLKILLNDEKVKELIKLVNEISK